MPLGGLSLHVGLTDPRLPVGAGLGLVSHTPPQLPQHLCPPRALGNATGSVSLSGSTDPRTGGCQGGLGEDPGGEDSRAARRSRRREEGDLTAARVCLPSGAGLGDHSREELRPPKLSPTGFSARNSRATGLLPGKAWASRGWETCINTCVAHTWTALALGNLKVSAWGAGRGRRGIPEAGEGGAAGRGAGGRGGWRRVQPGLRAREASSRTTGSPGRRARSPAGSPAPGTRCAPHPARCSAACSCTSWRTSSPCPASARCTPGGRGRFRWTPPPHLPRWPRQT